MHWMWESAIALLAGAVTTLAALTVWGNDQDLWCEFWTVYPGLFSTFLVAPGLLVCLTVFVLLDHGLPNPPTGDSETRCRKCGYILRGITEPRCPECGERI